MSRQLIGSVLVVVGLILQVDRLEGRLFGGWTGLLGLGIGAVGVGLLVRRVDRRLLGAAGSLALALVLALLGLLFGWPIADSQPGLMAALPFWVGAIVVAGVGVGLTRQVVRERRRSGPRPRVEIPRSVWFFFSAVCLGLAVWMNTTQLTIRYEPGGSTFRCGTAPEIVTAAWEDESRFRLEPHAWCLDMGQGAVLRGVALVVGSGLLAFAGVRVGTSGVVEEQPGHDP